MRPYLKHRKQIIFNTNRVIIRFSSRVLIKSVASHFFRLAVRFRPLSWLIVRKDNWTGDLMSVFVSAMLDCLESTSNKRINPAKSIGEEKNANREPHSCDDERKKPSSRKIPRNKNPGNWHRYWWVTLGRQQFNTSLFRHFVKSLQRKM